MTSGLGPTTGPNEFGATGGTGAPGRAIDGWLLRALLGVASLGLLALSLTGSQVAASLVSFAGVVLGILVVATMIAPGSLAPMLLLMAAVIGQLVIGDGRLGGRLAGLVALVPLVHQLAGMCAVIPPTSEVDLAALRPAALRYLAAVGVVEVGIAVAAQVI